MASRKRVLYYKNSYLNPTENFIYERIKNINRFKGYVLTERVKQRDDFPYPRLFRMRKLKKVPKFLRKRKISLIHAFFGTSAIRILPYKLKTSIPLISSFHGKDVSARVKDKKYRRKLNGIFRHSSKVMVVSNAMKKTVIKLGCPKQKIKVIKTGIDLNKFPFIQRTPPKDNEPTTFISIGRLVPKKGMDVLIRAFAQVHSRHPQTNLIIIGEGEMNNKLVKMINELRLESCVELKGRLSHKQVIEQLRKAHVFVLASRTAKDGDQEGIPNSLVEAMASGIPVVSTNHAGIPELIQNGKTGYLAAPGNIKDLAKKMEKLLNKKARWSKLTRAARLFVEKEHDIKKQARKMERIYYKVTK